MLLSLLGLTAVNLVYLVLHVTNSGSFPFPLTAVEERQYLDLLKSGDPQAKNVLIEHNLRLVAHIIKKYYSNARDQDDLISIGTIGLIKAVSTFDSDKGTRLATYAARCIENSILTYWLETVQNTEFVIFFTQKELGKRFGVSTNAVKRWENEKVRISKGIWKKLISL